MNVKRGNRRRGVLILVVLSILVMFGLMAITFVLITGQAKRTALVHTRSEQYFEPPDRITHEAALVLLRGPNNLAGAVGVHSLLEDMYGDEVISGNTTGALQICNGQLVNIEANLVSNPGTRIGCVLTMFVDPTAFSSVQTFPAAWRSTRIVGYDATTGRVQIVAFDDVPASAWPTTWSPLAKPLQYYINGAAFTGSGLGYNPNSGTLDLNINPVTGDVIWPTNPPRRRPRAACQWRRFRGRFWCCKTRSIRAACRKACSPTWRARQMLRPHSRGYSWPTPSTHLRTISTRSLFAQVLPPDATHPNGQILPSFHRPALVNGALADVLRRTLLRPNSFDHSAFTSTTNPGFNQTSLDGPWDVDTDGDGITDAIWTDWGLPARSMPDGRVVKPLVAAKIVDLDGRLNVNAHGTYAQTAAEYYGAVDPTTTYYKSWGATGASFIFWNSTSTPPQAVAPNLPRGFGYGPAEINLMPLFGDPSVAANRTAYNTLLQSRYAPSGFPGSSNLVDDPLHINKWFDYGGDYWSRLGWAYGSPPNRLGDGAVGLDPGGRPLYARMSPVPAQAATGLNLPARDAERLGDPYKMNLSKPTSVNTPFAPADLEGLLRQNDYDASRLPTGLTSSAHQSGRPPRGRDHLQLARPGPDVLHSQVFADGKRSRWA